MINYELKSYLNNPYIVTEEKIVGMLDERHDATNNDLIEEVYNVQIGDVVDIV